jgi:uncharacterized protein
LRWRQGGRTRFAQNGANLNNKPDKNSATKHQISPIYGIPKFLNRIYDFEDCIYTSRKADEGREHLSTAFASTNPMKPQPSTALTDAKIDQLGNFLDSIDTAMTLEEVDGFFCGLISGPDPVLPNEYLPHIFGGDMPNLDSLNDVAKIIGLLLQHWNHIAATLMRDKSYFPIMFKDEEGNCRATEWARAYMFAVELRQEGWARLLNDESKVGLMMPVMTLRLESDEDPKFRPGPIANEKRENIVVHMVAAVLDIYRYFSPERLQKAQQSIHYQHPKMDAMIPAIADQGRRTSVAMEQ